MKKQLLILDHNIKFLFLYRVQILVPCVGGEQRPGQPDQPAQQSAGARPPDLHNAGQHYYLPFLKMGKN